MEAGICAGLFLKPEAHCMQDGCEWEALASGQATAWGQRVRALVSMDEITVYNLAKRGRQTADVLASACNATCPILLLWFVVSKECNAINGLLLRACIEFAKGEVPKGDSNIVRSTAAHWPVRSVKDETGAGWVQKFQQSDIS